MPQPPLTFETLRKTRGVNAPQWYTVEDFDIHSLCSDVSVRPPDIGVVRSDDGEYIQGRFFPRGFSSYSAILIRRHNDDVITRATAVHELVHWRSYIEECGKIPSCKSADIRCRYKGEHDAEYYRRAEPMHRAVGIPLYAARAVEGTYPVPEHWNGSDWP